MLGTTALVNLLLGAKPSRRRNLSVFRRTVKPARGCTQLTEIRN
jgi:hypothetical protein